MAELKQIFIFMILVRYILALPGGKAYEKYIKWIVNLLVVLMILILVSRLLGLL